MAEEPAEDIEVAEAKEDGGEKKKPPILTMILFAVNSLFMGAVAFLLHQNNQLQKKKETVQDIVEGLKKTKEEEAAGAPAPGHEIEELVLVPLETFVVNLAGDNGSKYIKVDIELELSNTEVVTEIEKRKPQVRDIIITLLSSKAYSQINSPEERDLLREEIRTTINGFLITGKVQKIYFSQFIIS